MQRVLNVFFLLVIGLLIGGHLSRSAQGGQLENLPFRWRKILSHLSIVEVNGVETLRIEGVNVQIVNGLGATNGNPDDPFATDEELTEVNGLGNLIIGYNEHSGGSDIVGSHNLVVGIDNGATSFGGVIFGQCGRAGAPYVSITGGTNNCARALGSSIHGGGSNITYGDYSAIVGGAQNITDEGVAGTILGGFENSARSDYASVVGGFNNLALGFASAVLGGESCIAHGQLSTIGGGMCIEAFNTYNWAAGECFACEK